MWYGVKDYSDGKSGELLHTVLWRDYVPTIREFGIETENRADFDVVEVMITVGAPV